MVVGLAGGAQQSVRLSRRKALGLAGAFAWFGIIGCGAQPQPVASTPAAPSPAPTTTPRVPVPTETIAIKPSQPEPTATPVPSPTNVPTPVPREATWWTGPPGATWLAAASDVSRQVTRSHPEFTVRVSGGHGDFGRLVGSMASGQAPDVIDVGSIGSFASRGVIRTLDGYLSADTVSASNYPEPMWLNGSWSGKTYGVPALDHGPELGLVWNASLSGNDLTAVDPPKLSSLLYAVGHTLTQPGGIGPIDRLGFDPLDGVGSLLDTVRDVTGVDWYDPISRRVNLANSMYQEYIDGVMAYYSLIGTDRISQFRQDVAPMTDRADSGENQGKQVALLDGYWTVGAISRLETDRAWQFLSTWAPTLKGVDRVQRLGGRLAVIPSAAKNPTNSWDLIKVLASDRANQTFLAGSGHCATSNSFVAGGTWKQYPGLSFFVDSIAAASVLSGRGNNPVAGFAQVKWDQALQSLISGNQSSSEVLAMAQAAIEAEVRRLGG